MGIATLSVGGAALVADVTGAGTYVVLLHAGVSDRRMWRTTCEALSGKFTCILTTGEALVTQLRQTKLFEASMTLMR